MTPSYYYNDVKPWQRLPDPAFTNFEPEDFIAAMLSCRVDAAIDANTSDLRPVQRDYVSAAQRDQARLRTVDVV